MKKFIQSIVIAVAMLLSVNVWAGNPENAPSSTNVQNINTVIVEPVLVYEVKKDVEQVKCKVTAKICGKEYSWNITTSTEEDCNKIQIIAAAVSISLQNCN